LRKTPRCIERFSRTGAHVAWLHIALAPSQWLKLFPLPVTGVMLLFRDSARAQIIFFRLTRVTSNRVHSFRDFSRVLVIGDVPHCTISAKHPPGRQSSTRRSRDKNTTSRNPNRTDS
jgi:hypothetical protein